MRVNHIYMYNTIIVYISYIAHFRTHHESSIEYCYCSICTHDKIRRKVAKRAIERKKRKKQKERIHPTLQVPGWSRVVPLLSTSTAQAQLTSEF